MYIIDESYFQRELYVPNADELNSGANQELNQFIDSKVRLLMQNALGRELFADFDQYVVNGMFDEDLAPVKWLNLVNGVDYVYNDKTYKWGGLIVQEGAFKKSLLANFTFYHWLEYNQSRMTGVGEVVLSAKNAINVNPTQRLVKVWNDFVEMYQGSDVLNYPSYYRRGGVNVTDWMGNSYSDEYSSLVQFLSDNSVDYLNPNLKIYNKQNQLGL